MLAVPIYLHGVAWGMLLFVAVGCIVVSILIFARLIAAGIVAAGLLDIKVQRVSVGMNLYYLCLATLLMR